jgi:N-acetylglucosaminyl-diphospho-decaprenol L-rhamnosyltransferase
MDARGEPTVDVVIVSFNSSQQLREAVTPLSGASGIRVIVADNASSDESVESVADLSVTAIPLPENKGFAHACNVAWRAGNAPFVLLLNPDATIDAASLGLLVDVLRDNEGVGAAAPMIRHADGSLDHSLRRFPRLRSTYARALFLHRLFPRAAWVDEVIRDESLYADQASPDWVSGACILVRRTVLERLGGLDERFFMYCEDIDLCRRIWSAGWELRFEPRARARHDGGGSAPRAALLSRLAVSRIQYAKKHRGTAATLLERFGLILEAVTRAAVSRGGAATRLGHLRSLSPLVRRKRRH